MNTRYDYYVRFEKQAQTNSSDTVSSTTIRNASEILAYTRKLSILMLLCILFGLIDLFYQSIVY